MTGAPEPATIFALPEYAQAGRRFFDRALRALVVSKSPFLARIMGSPVEASTASINTTPTGETVRSEPLVVETGVSLAWRAGIEGDFDDLYSSLDQAAEQYAQSLTGQVFRQMTTVLSAYGNVLDAKGKDPAAAVFEMFERVEWLPDENGVVRPPNELLVTDPETVKVIERILPSLWQPLEELAKRKQAEYDARRRTRRLPRER
jgi:hypothetical protein